MNISIPKRLATVGGVLIVPIYDHKTHGLIVLGGILTIILGHPGGIAGAIYIGSLGVLLCYIAGIWLLVAAIRSAIITRHLH